MRAAIVAAVAAFLSVPALAQQPETAPPPEAAPAEPMAPAPMATPTAPAPMAAPMDSMTFRRMAMMSDGFEIAAARLALERSRNARVRSFAESMIRDHGMTSQALNGGRPVYAESGDLVTGSVAGAALGAGAGFVAGGPAGAAAGAAAGATTGAVARTAVPLDARKAEMLNQLAAAEGAAFDRMYGRMQVEAHREAIEMFTAYSQSGGDPALMTFAQQTLPHLEMHYGLARRLPQ